jgi:hypothetical protein
MYYVALMKDDGYWKPLDFFSSYSDAELHFDAYCDLYPLGYVDVVSKAEMDASLVEEAANA